MPENGTLAPSSSYRLSGIDYDPKKFATKILSAIFDWHLIFDGLMVPHANTKKSACMKSKKIPIPRPMMHCIEEFAKKTLKGKEETFDLFMRRLRKRLTSSNLRVS